MSTISSSQCVLVSLALVVIAATIPAVASTAAHASAVAALRLGRRHQTRASHGFTPGQFQQYNIADAAGAEAQVNTLKPAPRPASTPNKMDVTIQMILQNQHILRLGDRGPAVIELKQFFRLQPVNNIFDEALKAAVTAFQQEKRVVTPAGFEGMVGTTTMRCMLGAWRNCEVGQGSANAGFSGSASAAFSGTGSGSGARAPAAAAGNGNTAGKTRNANNANTAAGAAAPSGKYPGCNPSAAAIAQMQALYQHAVSNNNGGSRGRCFEWVWKYVQAKGFGKIRRGSEPAESEMCSNWAICFARFANNANSRRRWGLCKLNIQTPHDAPQGAIVVVGPPPPHGCGTSDPDAGDIAIAHGSAKPGVFINDGPSMSYGSRASFLQNRCKFLGAYVAVEV